MQVGHQGDSETVGEHQLGGYGIHYHSVRHGTGNECRDDGVNTRGGVRHRQTDRQTVVRLPLMIETCKYRKSHDIQVLGSKSQQEAPTGRGRAM